MRCKFASATAKATMASLNEAGGNWVMVGFMSAVLGNWPTPKSCDWGEPKSPIHSGGGLKESVQPLSE